MAMRKSEPQKTITLLLEETTGVLECVLGLFDVGDRRLLGPVATRVISGRVEDVSSSRLEAALRVRKWARQHTNVFREGRVVYD
jgi:hypothetical protein